jgi:hypothetical protein
MRKSILYLLTFLILATVVSSPLPGRVGLAEQEKNPLEVNIDFSGVEKFLELTTLLENDQEPTKEQWDALFATPGYRILIKNEFRPDFLMTRFRLAFMPSQKEKLAAQMKKETGWRGQFLPHYLRAKREREAIRAEIKRLKSMSFIQAAVDKAKDFLPPFEVKSYPPVSFVVFAPDARGYNPVVLDILFTKDEEEFLIDFVAHEFHHYYKNWLTGLNPDVLWVINQIHAEGIADQINRGAWFHNPERFAVESLKERNKQFLELYEKGPMVIREMDRLFGLMNDRAGDLALLGAELRSLVPQSGHPTGFYMANIILKILGKEALVSEIGNPFAFLRRYSRAAEKDQEAPSFSAKALEYISLLEGK